MKEQYRIPPYLQRVIVVICCFLLIDIVLPWYALSHKEGELLIVALFYTALMVAMLIYSLKRDLNSYLLDEDGITCMRFGKPIKQLSWQQVSQVGIAITGGPFRGGSNPFIIVTLEGAERFDPKKDVGGKYISEWEDHLIVIYKTKKAVECFEKTYGKFDYISSKN